MNSVDMIEAIKLNINSLDKHIFEKLLRKVRAFGNKLVQLTIFFILIIAAHSCGL